MKQSEIAKIVSAVIKAQSKDKSTKTKRTTKAKSNKSNDWNPAQWIKDKKTASGYKIKSETKGTYVRKDGSSVPSTLITFSKEVTQKVKTALYDKQGNKVEAMVDKPITLVETYEMTESSRPWLVK